MHNVFIHPSGQDDNLGDSALRAGLLQALQVRGYRLHIYLDGQTSDYISGLPLMQHDDFYTSRREWVGAMKKTERPIYILNAGEVNPHPGGPFPSIGRIAELRQVRERYGIVIAAGIGLKNPGSAPQVDFDRTLRDAEVISWRDPLSRDAAGFGESAPDWAFSLGSPSGAWLEREQRTLITVSLRFDRPWPDDGWLRAVRTLASRAGCDVVTIAQVARDAPRAVRLANALEADYLVAPSTRHDDLTAHVRSVYSRSLAVVSDRAHALIMGATEGAYPLGTGTDPGKIRRLLDAAGIGALTGDHQGFADRAVDLEAELPELPEAVDKSRRDLAALANRIHEAISAA